MDLKQALIYALEGSAILFAGSGFCYGAKNLKNESFKQGDGLRDALLKDCGKTSTTSSLSIVADYYIRTKSAQELITFLRSEFCLRSVADWHIKIMANKWKRVYTTNYDNVIEHAAGLSGINLQPMLVTQDTSLYNLSNICMHLNGHIDLLTTESIHNDFKLTDYSYSCDSLEGKPGFEYMKRDFKSAKAIIFIGYSLNSDVDVLRLLSSPEISEKTIFINKPNMDVIEIARFSNYGTCYDIGIEDFSKELVNMKADYNPPIGTFNYESFKHENMQTLETESMKYEDLINLFHFGSYKDSFCEKESYAGFEGDYKYLVERQPLDFFLKHMYEYKVFLFTSNLGNGKTIICNMIRNELRNKDVHVFTFKKSLIDLDDEIAEICKIKNKRCFVIIDNYQSKLSLLKQFAFYGLENITFILTARSSINIPNFRKLVNCINISEDMIKTISCDKLTDNEIKNLSQIFSRNNFLSDKFSSSNPEEIEDYISTVCNSRFSDLLLELFNSSSIKQRILETYLNISKDKELKKVLIFTLIRASMSLEIDFVDFLNITRMDYSIIATKEEMSENEFFLFNEDEVKIRSSIIARELLISCVDIDDILEIVKEIVFSADKDIKQYRNLLQNIVSHTHYTYFVKRDNAIPKIKNFYNAIRNTSFCSNNPFFWEQFAAFCIDIKDFSGANQCLSTAFVKAKEIDGFVPFQIETIKANCILEEILFESSSHLLEPETAIQLFIDCHSRLLKYFEHPDNNIKFVFKVSTKYKDFYDFYKDIFDARQKSIFLEKRSEILKKMSNSNSYECPKEWIETLKACTFN